MWNAWLDESPAGIKIVGRSINNLRHADDTTLMGEREEEQKKLLKKVKEERAKAGLKLNIQKIKIEALGSITLANRWGKKCKHWWAFFSWAPKTLQTVTTAMKLKDTCSLEKKLWQP